METGSEITLRRLRRTSPTAWANMRLCRLMAVLDAAPEAEVWVLHNPSAWLGTAFHRLMANRPPTEQDAEDLWSDIIRQLVAAATGHRLNRRFAKFERWPGYFLVKQRAIASAVRPRGARSTGQRESVTQSAGRERLLEARGGRLVGKPDLYDRQAVTEYKSSLPDASWEDAQTIIEGYWPQLRLYAVLIGEAGSWPAAMRIVSAAGQTLERPVDRRECEAEADVAVRELDATNEIIERAAVHQLASPNEIACGQCRYQAICPAFWPWAAASGWPRLRREAARGVLVGFEQGADGDLYSITLQLDGRFGGGGPQALALRKSIHGDLTGLKVGDHIRVTQALARPDGRLRADILTCVAGETNIPRLVSEGATQWQS